MKHYPYWRIGFSLIEVIAVLVILGILTVLGTQALTTIARGYILARDNDVIAQKAQLALSRMSVDLGYIRTSTGTPAGMGNYLNYTLNAGSANETHNLYQDGATLYYTVNDSPYVLADSLSSENGLAFMYYINFNDANGSSSASSNTSIVGITLRMHAPNWDSGVVKTYSTRVTINKY